MKSSSELFDSLLLPPRPLRTWGNFDQKLVVCTTYSAGLDILNDQPWKGEAYINRLLKKWL